MNTSLPNALLTRAFVVKEYHYTERHQFMRNGRLTKTRTQRVLAFINGPWPLAVTCLVFLAALVLT